MSTRPLKLVLVLGGLLSALVLGEALLCAVHFSTIIARPTTPPWLWLVYDPVVGRKNLPGYRHDALGFQINSMGFRGEDIRWHKPAGTTRIACLGDSATFGIWKENVFVLRARTAYPEELSTLLQAQGIANVEVINAGVVGNSTTLGLRELIAQVLPLQPDIVTIRYGQNDHALGRGPEISRFAGAPVYVLMQLLPHRAYDLELVRLGFDAYQRGLAGPPLPTRRVPIGEFEQNLHRFVQIARANNVRMLFIDAPYRAIERGESPDVNLRDIGAGSLRELHQLHQDYQTVLDRVAQVTNTPLLRTGAKFRESDSRIFTDYDLYHLNEAGAQLLAHLLLGELTALQWLDAPSKGRDHD